ncbi:MAG: hypothetical protein OXG27_13330 [Chloroflexi bacterium]|nr:hypothetical protein [Chloroflexota bacterium]
MLAGLSVIASAFQASAAPPSLPLCALSSQAQQQVDRLWGLRAVAVVDVRSRETWGGGDQSYAFTLHSTTKAVLAFAALTKLEQQGHASTKRFAGPLRRMVVLGENEAADQLFDWLGGAPALADFYRRIGARPLAAGVHDESWGLGRARVAEIARMFALLAQSPAIPDRARASALGLLGQTPAALHWRAYSVYALPEWTASTKSGWFWLEDDSQRINLVALLHDDAGDVRYAMALFYEGFALFDQVWQRFNAVIGWLAHDLSLREAGRLHGSRDCRLADEFLRRLGFYLEARP